jgi:hypothetical protein
LKGYDEPEILPSSIHPICLMSADGGQFKHAVEPPKAACSVGDKDVAQFLLSEGWAELAEGVFQQLSLRLFSSPHLQIIRSPSTDAN